MGNLGYSGYIRAMCPHCKNEIDRSDDFVRRDDDAIIYKCPSCKKEVNSDDFLYPEGDITGMIDEANDMIDDGPEAAEDGVILN